MTGWSTGEAAAKCGLSQHTLRWYERIGLLEAVERGPDGRRRYSEADLDWLSLLTKLRATGMPVREMLRYAELVRSGAGQAERLDLLRRHREDVLRAMAIQQECLKLLDHKIDFYTRHVCGIEAIERNEEIAMRITQLGDLTVSAQGLGCMGMSEWYGPTDWDESIATIHAALDLGLDLPRHR